MNTSEFEPLRAVAHIESPYKNNFAVPRQSGLALGRSKIVFEKEFRSADAVRELEGFSHIWLIWYFSAAKKSHRDALTVRPPRLGGNRRVGVFASRSPYRPNRIGLSCVKIENIDLACAFAPVITVSGADLIDGTPILDIKPYLPFADAFPDAIGGYAQEMYGASLEVQMTAEQRTALGDSAEAVRQILMQDPRPAYHTDDRTYKLEYDKKHIEFTVEGDILTVTRVITNNEA